ncbi:MAG TPA: VacJ family lipoprotein [Casimicrobiaceae bacterium]|nr:VacJ family lipoprotein [Casimicrobiaceae bacterium]
MNKAALRSKPCSMLLPLLAAVTLAGCAVGPTKEDPYEPFNRTMFSVHETVDDAVIKPVAQGYVAIVPEVIRTGVSNFFGNIDDLFTGINGLLQGNGYRAGDAFGRVLLNSSFGLGGIFDLASMMGITKDRNDFGITFGKWGFPQGPYLFIPGFGPTTVRDGAGWLVRLEIGPVGYIPDIPLRNSLYGLGYVDIRQQALATESVVETAAIDKYRFIRNAYLRARRYQLYDGHPPPEEDEEHAPAPGAAAPAPATQPPASTAPPPLK